MSEKAEYRRLMADIEWMGVPDSPGPSHAFRPGREQSPCGAYRHPRDKPYASRGGPCSECVRFYRKMATANVRDSEKAAA